MYDTRREALELAIRSTPGIPLATSADIVTRAEKFHEFLTKKEDQQ